MKKVKLAAMIVTLLSGLTILSWYILPPLLGAFTMGQAGAIGIIGGADGPTAIYTTAKPAPQAIAVIVIFIISLATWLTVLFSTRKK